MEGNRQMTSSVLLLLLLLRPLSMKQEPWGWCTSWSTHQLCSSWICAGLLQGVLPWKLQALQAQPGCAGPGGLSHCMTKQTELWECCLRWSWVMHIDIIGCDGLSAESLLSNTFSFCVAIL
jgi:hypothetical protein